MDLMTWRFLTAFGMTSNLFYGEWDREINNNPAYFSIHQHTINTVIPRPNPACDEKKGKTRMFYIINYHIFTNRVIVN